MSKFQRFSSSSVPSKVLSRKTSFSTTNESVSHSTSMPPNLIANLPTSKLKKAHWNQHFKTHGGRDPFASPFGIQAMSFMKKKEAN